jgi:hypothetical protein
VNINGVNTSGWNAKSRLPCRPKDLQDIRAMLLTNKGHLDLDRIRRDARVLLTDASWNELDDLLRQCS